MMLRHRGPSRLLGGIYQQGEPLLSITRHLLPLSERWDDDCNFTEKCRKGYGAGWTRAG